MAKTPSFKSFFFRKKKPTTIVFSTPFIRRLRRYNTFPSVYSYAGFVHDNDVIDDVNGYDTGNDGGGDGGGMGESAVKDFLKKKLANISLASILFVTPVLKAESEKGNGTSKKPDITQIDILTDEENFIARVIFAETLNCSSDERLLVASVIKNRIGHRGFGSGKLKTMYDVVKEKRAFSCINDSGNKQWNKSGKLNELTPKERQVWNECAILAKGNFKAVPTIVYYHDKSIKKPASWDNKYWSTKLEKTTTHFSFYSVESK